MSGFTEQDFQAIRRRLECPLPWCTGRWIDHGGDGDSPEEWIHSDDGTDLPHGAALYRTQIGAEAVVWEMVAGGSVVAHGLDLSRLAEKLRDIAAAIDENPATGC